MDSPSCLPWTRFNQINVSTVINFGSDIHSEDIFEKLVLWRIKTDTKDLSRFEFCVSVRSNISCFFVFLLLNLWM